MAQRRPRRRAVPGSRPRQGHGVHGSQGSPVQKVGGRRAQGTGGTAGTVRMDRGPQPEAGGGDERAEGERGADAVPPRAHQLLPGARHWERVREGQAVPGPVPQGPRPHRRLAQSHVYLRGLRVRGPGRRRRRRGRGGSDHREPGEGAEGRGSEPADRGFPGPEADVHASGAGPCSCRSARLMFADMLANWTRATSR